MKRMILAGLLLAAAAGLCFAKDFITLAGYWAGSKVAVNEENAAVLVARVNALLTSIGAPGVTITSAARPDGVEELHPQSRAIDLRWNQRLYDDIVANIGGTGLRVECIDCIRELRQADHIHLDIGRGSGDALGRWFGETVNHYRH